jgi:serine/threonine-protein kinase
VAVPTVTREVEKGDKKQRAGNQGPGKGADENDGGDGADED